MDGGAAVGKDGKRVDVFVLFVLRFDGDGGAALFVRFGGVLGDGGIEVQCFAATVGHGVCLAYIGQVGEERVVAHGQRVVVGQGTSRSASGIHVGDVDSIGLLFQ